jgi:putative pyrroloquinoline-quinone binding quinoprotein
MTGFCRFSSGIVVMSLAAGGLAQAQGRGGGAWTTAGSDAQRTSSIRTDPKISPAAMQQPGFQFLWKRKFDSPAAQSSLLTQPILLPNIIAYKGFKALAFVGSRADNVYAVDYELNRIFWTQHLATGVRTAGTAACPGGLNTITKATAAGPAAAGGRGRGAGGGGAGAPQGPVMPGGRDAPDNVFAISSGGMVHLMNPQVGTDQIPPVKFLPPNARVVGSILVDNVMYAATTGHCGGAANGVWAVDLVGPDKAVKTFDTRGAGVAGAVAPTFGTDGAMYIATGSGDSPVANAVVSLNAKTLEQKDWFTAGAMPFTSAPVVFQYKGKDLIVAANKDGRLYVLDSASIGGADHRTPLYKTAEFTAAPGDVAGLASWVDSAGTRWVVATTSGPVSADAKIAMSNGTVSTGALVAFTVTDNNDAPTLQPQWVSADIKGPLTPAVINGVVFALGAGDAAGARAQRPAPAVLYALDGATGKQLWTSGTTITAPAHSAGPSGGDSQVYVVADDGTLYAFGMPAER